MTELGLQARGHRVVNSNSSVYYLGWNPISFGDIYIDIAEGIPASQRHLLLGGEVSVWTDHYTAPVYGLQCGVESAAQPNPAKRMYPRSEDAAFGKSTLGVTFPAAVIAADSWWRYDPALHQSKLVSNAAYRKRLAEVNARLVAAGVDSCPTSCMWAPHSHGGCNETSRCGVDYVPASSLPPLLPPPPPPPPQLQQQQQVGTKLGRRTTTAPVSLGHQHRRLKSDGIGASVARASAGVNTGTQPKLNAAFSNLWASQIGWTQEQFEEDLSYMLELGLTWAFITYTSCDDHATYTAYCWSGATATNKTQVLYKSGNPAYVQIGDDVLGRYFHCLFSFLGGA